MKPETLTIINTKNNRFDTSGRGIPVLTADMVNAAMSRTNTVGLGMLKIRVCGDESDNNETFKALYREVKALSKGWKQGNDDDRLKSLVQLAMYEHNHTPVCPACKGRKYNRRHKPCAPCKGKGKYIIRDSQRARAIDVLPSSWSRVWDCRYRRVQQLISEKESLALKQINKRIGRD